jgi:NADH-quinone oxidoreductase subunit F
LVVDENTLTTNIPGVFAGGDFTTGPTFVIRAIASGRRGAISIARYLIGEKGRITIPDEKTSMAEEKRLALEEESPEEHPRIKAALEEPESRMRDFREVEKGFTEEEAIREAVRCLRCDLEKELMEAEELEKLSSKVGRDDHD